MVSCFYELFYWPTKCGIIVSYVTCGNSAFVCVSDGVSEVFSGRINTSVVCYIEVL